MADGPSVPKITLPTVSFGNTAPAPAPVGVAPTAAALDFLNNPEAMRQAAAARQNGNAEFTAGMMDEIRNLPQADVVAKYGPEVAARRNEILTAEEAFRRDSSTERDADQIVGDTALGVVSSGVGMLYGAAGLLNSVAGPEAAVATAQAGEDAQEWIRSFQSEELSRRRDAAATMRSLDYAESEAAMEAERANGSGELVSGLRRIGRDAITYAASIASDPALAGDVTAEAIGSLIPSTGAIKVANAVTRGTRAAAAAGPAAIGAMEAGGANSQAINEVMAMSEEQLMAGSADYRDLRELGLTHEEAQTDVAGATGLQAAGTQFPLAMAAGIGVARFEAAPLRAGSVPEIGRNVVSETVEEAVQGGTGQVSGNLAIQENADDQRALSEGVGEAVAAGAIGGLGMAGVLQSPALAVEGARATAGGAVAAANARLTQVNEGIRKAGGATREAVTQSLNALDQLRAPLEAAAKGLPDPVAGVTPPASVAGPSAVEGVAPVATPEEAAPVAPQPEQVAATRVLETITVPQEEMDALPETIRPIVTAVDDAGTPVPDRSKMLIQAAVTLMQNPDLAPEAKRDTALFAYDQIAKLQSFVMEEEPADVAALDEANPIRAAYNEAKMTLEAVTSIPEIAGALKAALEIEMEQSDPENVSPKGATVESAVVAQATQVATANPAGVDVQTVDRILEQNDGLTPEKKSSLMAARAVRMVAENATKAKEAVAQTFAKSQGKKVRPTSDIVRKQIMIDGKETKDPNRILPSLNDFARYINTSMSVQGNYIQDRKGQPINAQGSFDRLGDFAQHMIYKIEAFNKSAALNGPGKGVPDVQVRHKTLTADGWVSEKSDAARPIGVTLHSPQSRQVVQNAYVDAMAAVELYNSMVDVYGDRLGGKKLTLPTLDARITPDLSLPQSLIADPQSGSVSDPNRDEPVDLDTTGDVVVEDEPVSDEESGTDDDPNREEEKIDRAAAEADRRAAVANAPKATPAPAPKTQRYEGYDDLTDEELAAENAKLDAEEAAERAKPRERRLRKNAVLKVKESLIDRTNAAGTKYDRTVEQLDKAVRTAKKQVGRSLAQTLARNASTRVKPSSDLGKALKAAGITSKTNPGLFGAKGREAFDNLVASEWEDRFPGISEAAGIDDNGYLDANGMEDLILRSAQGDNSWNYDQQELDQLQSDLEEATRNQSDELAGIPVQEGEKELLTAVVEEEVPQNLLKNKDGISRFARAFRAKKGSSLLAGLKNPLAVLAATFKSNDRIKVFSMNDIEYMIPVDQRTAMLEILQNDVPGLIDKLNARLNSVDFHKGKGVIEAYKAGRWVTDFMEGKAAALVDPETGQYDRRLAEMGVIAGIHWALNARKNKPQDEEEIAKSFGWSVETYQNNPDLQKLAAFGMDDSVAKEGMAQAIMDFMGIQAVETVTMSDTKGIIEGFAAEVLYALDGTFVEIENLDSVIEQEVEDENGAERIEYLPVKKTAVKTDTEKTDEKLEKLKGLRTILGDMILKEDSQKHRYVGAPPRQDVKKTQRKNRFSKLSTTERDVLRNLRKIEFYRNTPFLDFLNAMGKDSTGSLFGSTEIAPRAADDNFWYTKDGKRRELTAEDRLKGDINRKHKKTVEGKNLSNVMSWEGVMEHDDAIRSYAEANGMSPDDVPTFYDWYITKVGRHGMEGFGPQSDKLAREAFVSTTSILDLTNPEHMEFFWMTVAQSSGISKTEKDTRSKAIGDTQEVLGRKWPESLRILTEWYAAKQDDPEAQISLDQQNAIVKEFGGNATAKQMHALLAVAQLDYAMSQGDGAMQNFVHMLSLEADGKTDGPINAMMHFTSGEFNAEQLRLLAKGGLFINEDGKTLNQQYASDKDDLYNEGATRMADLMRALKKTLRKAKSGNSDPVKFMEALERFSSQFGDISFNDKGEVVVGRNTMKNPLTVTTYGSGINGITGKVANALLDAFYEQLTASIKGDQDNKIMNYKGNLQADLQLLFGGVAVYSKKKKKWFGIEDQDMRGFALDDPWNFEFTEDQRANFMTNVRGLMVTPMNDAIQSLMSGTTDSTKRFQLATQIQSAVMMDKFMTAVQDALKAKKAAGDSDYLSQAEYDKIFADLEIYGAIVENNVQTLNMGTKERSQSNKTLSSALDATIGGTASLSGPSSAGVRASPYITIARGDAMMINNIYAAEDAILRSLPVFDGVELAADIIDTASERINKAVADAWLEQNPAQDVADSFAAFLREKPFSELTDAGKLAVADAIARYKTTKAQEAARKAGTPVPDRIPADVSKLDVDTQKLDAALRDTAFTIQLRKDTLKEVLYSVDHMASAESPYTYRGQALRTDIPLHEALNEIYNAKKAERSNNNREAVEKPSTVFTKAVAKAGRGLGDGAVSLSVKGLKTILSRFNDMSPDQRRVADLVRKNLHGDMTFLFGESGRLTQLRNERFPERSKEPAVKLGQIDLKNKTVYVANQSVETTLHEAIHAITMQKIFDFYLAPGKLKAEEIAAVERLEVLMDDFMGRDFLVATEAAQSDAALQLQEQINTIMAEGQEDSKAAALNEFVAWSLSNENLIRLNKATRSKNPLARITEGVLKALGKLFRMPDGDIFSHILFNASVLAMVPKDETSVSPNRVLHHMNPKADTRIQDTYDRFEAKIGSFLKARMDADPKSLAQRDVINARELGLKSTDTFMSAGYTWTEEQRNLFATIQAVMATQMEIEPVTLIRAQKLYREVLKNLSYEDLMADPNSTDVADITVAQEKFKALTGQLGNLRDDQGNTNLMSSFLALAQVDDQFRKALAKIDVPKALQVNYQGTMDQLLDTTGSSMMDSLGVTLTREGRHNTNIQQALDKLTDSIGRIEKDAQTAIELQANSLLDRGDGYGTKLLEDAGEWAGAVAGRRQAESRSKTAKAIYGSVGLLSGFLNENRGKASVRTVTAWMNKTDHLVPLKEMFHEAVGMTDENKGVYALVGKVKYAVSAMRQDYREKLPNIFNSKFTVKLTPEQKKAMHLVLGKADIAALRQTMSVNQIIGLLQDGKKLDAAVQKAKADLEGMNSYNFASYDKKAKQLARFMVDGTQGHNLLTNAYSISKLLNEKNVKVRNWTPQLEGAIDRLTSLYALQMVDMYEFGMVQKLATEQADGIAFMTEYLSTLRITENEKATSEVAKLNGFKGYIPNEAKEGVRLVVQRDSLHQEMVEKGFVRKGSFNGPLGKGRNGETYSYYYSAVAGRGTYSQGAMQTVQIAVNGVDPLTGRTLTGITAGGIQGTSVKYFNDRLQAKKSFTLEEEREAFLPRFDEDGNLAFFERMMHPIVMNTVEKSNDLGEMMGAWHGRIVEERVSTEFNAVLVERLKEVWDEAVKNKETDEFINLAEEQDDKVLNDTWGIIPVAMRRQIEATFGEGVFMVRRDMALNALGTRNASVSDAFTGDTRLPEEAQKAIINVAKSIFGEKAFAGSVITERAIQTAVSSAKDLIVIRSMIVPAMNFMSNVNQLVSAGVPWRKAVFGNRAKLVEIDTHLKNLTRRIEIKAELQASQDDNQKAKLRAEFKSIEDSDRKMSIWPLIEEGLFTTISEGMTELDASLANGRFQDWVETQVNKLPEGVKTFGKYALVTRDTALYQGMSRAVQYGDFLAKSTFYDHLLSQGMKPVDAMNTVREEFIEYNFLAGRTRTYAESMGLLWFWNYKVRSMKIGLRMAKRNPLRLLTMAALGAPLPDMGIGSPISDNFASLWWQGKLGWSMGPGMLFNAAGLNPWFNMIR